MKKATRVLSLLAAAALLLTACGADVPPVTTVPTSTPILTTPHQTQPTTQPATTPPTTHEPTQPVTQTTQPQPESFTLSFAGDCTFGDNVDAENSFGTFCKVVGDKYTYPLSNVKEIFKEDDYSFVNVECALTESEPTEEEMEALKENLFRFRGPKEYARILVEGGVEFGSCANNHSRDYGKQGLYDTWDALETAGIDYASFGRHCIATTESGLTIGIFAVFFGISQSAVKNQVKELTDKGAELIVMSIHWGDEGTYHPNDTQTYLGRMAVDAGVDIVYGHHSHTLQPVEAYNGGIIYYSLGNFSFGGNRNPSDKDTAILQQQVLRWPDGTVTLGALTAIPCRVSTVDNWNDYRPTPYTPQDAGYSRVFAKLEGSFDGADVKVPYQTEPTTPAAAKGS